MKLGKILGVLLVLVAMFSVMGCPEPEVPYVEKIINVEEVFLEVSTSEEGVNVTITLPDELVGKDISLLNICRNAPEFKLEYSEMEHQDFWNYNSKIEENYLYARWYSYDDYISKASYTFVDNFVNSDTDYSYSCHAVVDGDEYYSKNYNVTTKTVKYGEFSSYKPDLSTLSSTFDVQKYIYEIEGSYSLKNLPENWYNNVILLYSDKKEPGKDDLVLDYFLKANTDGFSPVGMSDELKSEYKNKRLTLQWIKQILFYELPEEESVNNYFIYENPDKDYVPPYEDLHSCPQFVSQTLEKPASIMQEISTYTQSQNALDNLVGIYSDTNSILEFLRDGTVTLDDVDNNDEMYNDLPFTEGTYEILSDKRVIIMYEKEPLYDGDKTSDYCSCELTEYGIKFYRDEHSLSYVSYYKKQELPNDISTVGKWNIETNSTNLDLIINNDGTYYIIDMDPQYYSYEIYEQGTVTRDMNFYTFTGKRTIDSEDYDVTYIDIQNSEGNFVSRKISEYYPFKFVTEQTFHETFYYDKWFEGEYPAYVPLKLWSDDLKYVLYIGWKRNNNSGTFYYYDEYKIFEVILDEAFYPAEEKLHSDGSFKITSEDSALFTPSGKSEGETVVMSATGVITVDGKNFLIDTGASIEGTWVNKNNKNVKFITNDTEESYQWIDTEKEEYISLGWCQDCRCTSSYPSGFSLGWVFGEENVDYYAIPVSETTLYIADLINNTFEIFEKESDNSELPYGYSGEDKLKDTGFISKNLNTVIKNIDGNFEITTYCGPNVSSTWTNYDTEYYYINENKVQVFIPEISYIDATGEPVYQKIFSKDCINFTSDNSFTYQGKEYFKAQQITCDDMIGTWSDGEGNTIKFSKDGEYDKCEFRTYNDYYYVEDRGWDFLSHISIPNISFIGDGTFSEVFEGVLSYDGTLCVSTGFENQVLYLKKQ